MNICNDAVKVPQKFCASLQILVPLWLFIYLIWIGLPDLDGFITPVFQWDIWRLFSESFIVNSLEKYAPIVVGIAALTLFFTAGENHDKESLGLYRRSCLYVVVNTIACTLVAALLGYSSIGYIGVGFSLLSIYFAVRLYSKKASIYVLVLVLVLGYLFEMERLVQGAYPLSQMRATLALDWAVSAGLFLLFFNKNLEVVFFPKIRNVMTLVFLTVSYWVIFLNIPFFSGMTEYFTKVGTSNVPLIVSSVCILIACYFVIFNSLRSPRIIKPLLILFSLLAVAILYFALFYGVIINKEMAANILATDYAEASAYISLPFFAELIFLLLPPIYLVMATKAPTPKWKTVFLYSGSALAIGCLVLAVNFKEYTIIFRDQPTIKSQISPANMVFATYKTLTKDSKPGQIKDRLIIDENPVIVEPKGSNKGSLVFVVVGETARKANWGLSGYPTQTNPMLNARGVINFSDVTSCGTSTDVSLPCMFSRVGRAEYDRKKILQEESLLPLLKRAGVNVFWVDNQSGCKGVCDGVETLPINKEKVPSLCKGDVCYDEALLAGIEVKKILNPNQTTVVFMHQLGSHGPSYYKRYPQRFEKYTPVCKQDRLDKCSQQELVNTYNNTILYTDYFLSGLIDWLDGLPDMDTALLYISDHGESLGEKGIYLHGYPELIAPKEQKEIPMVLWLSNGMKQKQNINESNLAKAALEPITHDYIYSSLLTLLNVESKTYTPELDLFAKARLNQSILQANITNKTENN